MQGCDPKFEKNVTTDDVIRQEIFEFPTSWPLLEACLL